MKKFLSMALAAAMAMSLASVAFAADTKLNVMVNPGKISDIASNKFNVNDDGLVDNTKTTFVYGDTVYYPLIGVAPEADGTVPGTVDTTNTYLVYESDAVKGLKIKDDWHMGKSYVDGVELVKKKTVDGVQTAIGGKSETLAGAKRYAYYVAVELKDTMKTGDADIYGTIELDKKATKNSGLIGATEYADKIDEKTFDVNLTVTYGKDTDACVGDKREVFFDPSIDDEEYELNLVTDDEETATFTVDARGQGKLVLSANNDFNAAISAKYPMANLEFINVEASDSFNRIGTLRVYAEEGQYLYALNADGEITNSKAKYDADDECYVMRTRTLGSFVLSDTELNVAPVAPVVPEVKPEVKPFNPGTGAAC